MREESKNKCEGSHSPRLAVHTPDTVATPFAMICKIIFCPNSDSCGSSADKPAKTRGRWAGLEETRKEEVMDKRWRSERRGWSGRLDANNSKQSCIISNYSQNITLIGIKREMEKRYE